jgi:hypothetical protein
MRTHISDYFGKKLGHFANRITKLRWSFSGMLERWFLAHPKSVGESYFEHQRMALGFAAALLKAGFACLIHGFVPGLFQSTGSRTVAALHERMITKRVQQWPQSESESQQVLRVTSAAPDRRSAGA